jgi:hypothetical protein
MKSKAEFFDAKQLLLQCIKYAEAKHNFFGTLRDLTELSVLYYALFFRAKLGNLGEWSVEPSEFDKFWKHCFEVLEEASRMAEEQLDVDAPLTKSRQYQRVLLQIYGTKVALAIYQHWMPTVGRYISEQQRIRQRADLDELKILIDDWNAGVEPPVAPYTALVFSRVLEYILADPGAAEATARLEAVKVLERILKFKNELLDFDREQFMFFFNRILAPR